MLGEQDDDDDDIGGVAIDDGGGDDERATAVARPTMLPPIIITSWSGLGRGECEDGVGVGDGVLDVMENAVAAGR